MRGYAHRICYEAPPVCTMRQSLIRLLRWSGERLRRSHHPLQTIAVTHAQFELLHPFEDGNGRVGRLLFLSQLSWLLGVPVVPPISSFIDRERQNYYTLLERLGRAEHAFDPELGTEWIGWILVCLDRAVERANDVLEAAHRK